jgi:uncharacterized membrane protein YccC
VGIPAALALETAFDHAVGRCIEITFGIGCATLMSQMILPQPAGEALKASINATSGTAQRYRIRFVRTARVRNGL